MIEALLEDLRYSSSGKAPTCLDLFSGAGGLSVGFAMAGGRPLGAVDIDNDSIQTYSHVFPFAKDVVCGPIESWRPKAKPGDVDVIIGGPPCQGFSLARGLRFTDDQRNHLYKYFVELLGYYKPKWFVMENVEGITNIGKGTILKQILEDFAKYDYLVDYKVINMAEFGVPQLRKRAIFVGNRVGSAFAWPIKFCFDSRKISTEPSLFESPQVPFYSVNSVLSDMILPQGNYFAHRANAQMRGPRNRNAHTEPAFTLRVRGDEFALCEVPAISAFVPGNVPDNEVAYRASQNELQEMLRGPQPSWARARRQNKVARKKPPMLRGTRRLTIREQARLQSFPDWVEFYGRITSQAKQIGNAVPPIFGYQLFRSIIEQL